MRKEIEKTRLREIMSRHVVKVNADEQMSLVQTKFANDHVTHIVVVDSDDKVVGLISQKYLYKTKSPRKVMSDEMRFRPDLLREGSEYFYTKDMLDSYILAKVMQKKPLTLSADDTVQEAIISMADRKIGCIPIVDKNNKVTGIITHQEVLAFLRGLLK